MILLLGPGFVVSPGLVQKAFGAESARAVRIGLGVAGVAQLVFSFLPVLLGMAARVHNPDITNTNLVLPSVMVTALPVWIGALGLAAIFSAEVSTCDAILFMLSTSISKDVYQRFINRAASPDDVLRVARIAAVTGGVLGMFMAVQLSTVADALRIFYSVLIATLFFPVAGGLLWPRAGSREAMAAIVCGIVALAGRVLRHGSHGVVGSGPVGPDRQRRRVFRDADADQHEVRRETNRRVALACFVAYGFRKSTRNKTVFSSGQ